MLEVRDLRVRYGSIEALRGVSLTVGEGELVALIGSNGAGKSTCLKAITGILRPVQGSIRLGGEELATEPAHRIVARGVALVPEGRRLFGDQTVMDNLLLGAYRRRTDGHGTAACVPAPRIASIAFRSCGSGGTRQRAALAVGSNRCWLFHEG